MIHPNRQNRFDRAIFAMARSSSSNSKEVRALAAAIICAEMQFRPFVFRIGEYIYALIRLAINKNIDSMTLGVAQVSLRHYRDFLAVDRWRAVLASTDLRTNWQMCCLYLEKYGCYDVETAVNAYNGVATTYYRRTVSNYFAVFIRAL